MSNIKNFIKKYMNLYDFFYIGFLILVSITLYVGLFISNSPSNGDVVVINYNSGQDILEFPLNEDRLITLKKEDYPLLLADMVIEITDNAVRIKEETSPFNYCSKLGWIRRPPAPLVCLPNYVVVVIERRDGNNNDVDAVIGYALK